MPSTRGGNEPFSTSDLAPSDRELYPAQSVDVGLRVRTKAGEDPTLVAERAAEIICDALEQAGDPDADEILDRIREA